MKKISNSNVLSLVQAQGEMEAKGKYYYEPLDLEVSLIGFVPVFAGDPFGAYSTGAEMNSELLVTPYRVRAKSCQITVPVLQRVAVAKNKTYLVSRSLCTKIPNSHFKVYYQQMEEQGGFLLKEGELARPIAPIFNPFGGEENKELEKEEQEKLEKYKNTLRSISESQIKRFKSQFSVPAIKELTLNENGMLVYNSGEYAYELTRTHGDYTCVFDGFLCLCTFFNKVTGLPSYALFSPENIIVQDKQKDGK